MKLYELSNQFTELFDNFEDIDNYTPGDDEEIPDLDAFKEALRMAWFDTLTGIEAEFDDKAENIACYIKSLSAEVKAMKAEEDALKRRRKAMEKSVERLKGYLLGSMLAIGRSKIDTPRAHLSVRNNAESIVIDDTVGFIGWAEENAVELLKYAAPEIRKTDAKKLLQAGEELPFAHLTRTQSLTIK